MDYIKQFSNYCEVFLNGKRISVSNSKTKTQRISDFERSIRIENEKIIKDFNTQIDAFLKIARNDGYKELEKLNNDLINKRREIIRNFENEQKNESGLFD